MGKLTDIYRLYSLYTIYIGKLADIYRLCFSCTPSIGKLTDIYRLYLSPPSMGKLTDIYGIYFLCTTHIGKLADIYRLYFLLTPSMGELTDIYGTQFLYKNVMYISIHHIFLLLTLFIPLFFTKSIKLFRRICLCIMFQTHLFHIFIEFFCLFLRISLTL
mgnify:CR=1 FL=1